MSGLRCSGNLGLTMALLGLVGCAQTFRPLTIPSDYAARPIKDFSSVDLTPFIRGSLVQDRILPGDRLEVRLNSGAWDEQAVQTWHVGVDQTGQVTLPNIGPVKLAGLTTPDAEKSIVQASLQRDVFLTPVVGLTMTQRHQGAVTVIGAVNAPGTLAFPGNEISLADVLVRAGGLTEESSGRITISGNANLAYSGPVLVPVGQTTVARTIDLHQTSGPELAEIMVPQGAFVSVEKAPPREIQLIGVIRNQAIEIPPGKNFRLLDALTLAGGPSYSGWILDKVYVFRKTPGSNETIQIKASIRKAKKDYRENLLLAPNDVVSVEENIMTFTLSTVQSIFAVGTTGMRFAVP